MMLPPRLPSGSGLEVQAASVQQAIQKALALLQATRNQVRVTVLSEGQPGLFGMRGKKQAKVRVTVFKKK